MFIRHTQIPQFVRFLIPWGGEKAILSFCMGDNFVHDAGTAAMLFSDYNGAH